MISVFFSKAKLASACAGIIYFTSYVPCIYIQIREESLAFITISEQIKTLAVSTFIRISENRQKLLLFIIRVLEQIKICYISVSKHIESVKFDTTFVLAKTSQGLGIISGMS